MKAQSGGEGRSAKVVVIGAGVGGLTAAARLAKAGFEVTVLEKTEGPGGRCAQLTEAGFTFDMGPTILLMPEVLEETFASLGERLSDHLTLERCDPNYRIHWCDGSELTFSSELCEMGRELERIEPGSYARYLAFLAQGRVQYETSLAKFVGRNFDGLRDYLTPSVLRDLFRIRAHRTMWNEVGRFFKDERLRQALTFQTMYLGVSPYESPAVYALLPFTELGVGIWFPRGGLYAIPQALERVATKLGVTVRYGASVARVVLEGKSARGVELEGGERIDADAVVCNADLPWAYRNLIDPAVTRLAAPEKLRYTSSGYMLYLGLDRKVPGLFHHNVFFGRDYRASFDDIFQRLRTPEDPSFYVCVPSRTDPTLAPEGKDGLYVLVPAPRQNEDIRWREEGPKVRAKVFARLKAEGFGELEDAVEMERIFTPDDWAATFNLEHGSAFGLAQDFFQVGPFRPANQDPVVKNLFFVGASTQPGTGLPTVMVSGRLVTERVVGWARAKGFVVDAPAARATGATKMAAALEAAA